MRKISTILACTCLFLVSEAKVRTVSNNPSSPGQFTSLQTAIDSSKSGDTIYVHGSATTYGNITVKKRLVFIGTGSNPNKSNKLVSQVGFVHLDTAINVSGTSGTKIIGFTVGCIYGYAGAGGTKNISISRNYINGIATTISITGKGWTFENNIIALPLKVNNNSSIVIRNNIFNKSTIQTSNQNTVIISNNIFLGVSPITSLSTVSNALIANNIFSGSSPKGANVDNNTFSNNITYQTAYDTIPFGTNTGSGNFVAKDPKYKNVPANNFSYTYDFALDTISPGKNAGTDGKDVGIYGGVRPFADMTGAPAIPQLKSLGILNPVIPVGDSLRVVIKANKQN